MFELDDIIYVAQYDTQQLVWIRTRIHTVCNKGIYLTLGLFPHNRLISTSMSQVSAGYVLFENEVKALLYNVKPLPTKYEDLVNV